ncbi:GntR family transcriptional regulator [Pontibacillus litoralis]|uniref:GntR family transcriptional regulator n=1 Tax=Pontibacillus litoralis JSM 072002 TaxID=1385512 RepID=A0A0A5G6R8_9BACI|nr:GntR family transcriptional regulator [Pontibacillus litoralis]KGX86863.1 GntR family transcriptional regulator [Pontibacillus litoralis JSM 072002]
MTQKKQLHSKVKRDIIEKIENGTYRPGRNLPTEAEFCSIYDVSRTTIRTALNHLIMEGYIFRKQGKGTFVAKGKVRQSLSASQNRFAEQLASQGLKPKIEVNELITMQPSEKLQQTMKKHSDYDVHEVKRTRYADNEVLQFEIAYVRADLVPTLTKEMVHKSLYGTIEQQGNTIKRTEEQLKIIIPDEEIAHHLNLSSGAPCFQITTKTFLTTDEIVEYSEAYFRGDKVEFFIERNYQ